jgi:regulator of protease activity HflC (stomatin/prohibitin superfamily)
MFADIMLPLAVAIVLAAIVWIFKCLNIMREYERAVVFRLGRVLKHEKGPGLVLILWPIDTIVKVSLVWSPGTCRRRTSSLATTCRSK